MNPTGRKQLLVDRTYQLRIATRLILTIFAVAIASFAIGVLLLWSNLNRPELTDRYYLIAGLIGGAVVVFVELILVIPVVTYVSILLCHRVIRPKRRLIKTLNAIGEGDFTQRFLVRKGDALEDVAQAVNDMARRLGQK